MKKKKKQREQLNKTSLIKLLIAIAVVILLEIAAGIFIFAQFSSHTYGEDFAEYKDKINSLSQSACAKLDGGADGLEQNSAKLDSLKAALDESGSFDYYVVFSQGQGGRLISGEDVLGTTLLPSKNLSIDKVDLVELNGKTYVFAPAVLGESSYGIGGLADFTERQAVISNFRGNVIAVLVAVGILMVATLVVYARLVGNRVTFGKYKYRLVLDKQGNVLRANEDFKREFASVAVIPTQTLDKNDFNLVPLTGNGGEKLVAMRLHAAGDKTKVFAGDVANADSFIQTQGGSSTAALSDGQSTASLSHVFESFLTRGKRTLLGVMYINNLEQIKTLFGKQMALDIQATIIKKVREKFTYAYELDFASIGVTYPDGKKLDILMSDLDDIYRYICTPIKKDDNLFTIELKSGFAMCDSSMETLNFDYAFKAAEAARQRAMDTKIADYIVYHESQKKLYAKYFIEFNIKQMLAEGAFEMEYQPQYNIKEERIEGFEALFRVKKSWNVNVDTFSFITYAERTGAMVQLGDFIFDTGMRFAKQLEGKNVSVSLNVSPVQLMQAGFTENFLKLYKKYNLKPGSICVEITESFLMTNFTETMKKLDILTSNGITVHLDDFGTEYSSLLYIKKLPISTIKIDKEFVKDVLTSKESQAVIKFITNIAKLLDLTTICEGVETTQEFDMLNYLGCDTIQGWLIGKSMKPEAALAIVDNFDYRQVAAAKNGK